MTFFAASQELKNKIQEICPNTANLPVEQWLKLAALEIRMDYSRLYRLWRDNRAKPEPHETRRIQEALEEAQLLRDIKRLQLKQKYLQHLISGEIQEHEKALSTQSGTFGKLSGGTFA